MGTARYSEEFRAAAVAMVLEKGRTPKQAGEELGVHEKSIKEWIKRHQNNQRGEYVRMQELEREVRHLKKELAEAQEAVEILKKTAAILSKR